MAQKVLRVGSSAAVTIPKKTLDELGIEIGDKVFTYTDSKNGRIIYSKKRIDDFVMLTKRDKELLAWTNDFIKRYKQDLKALTKQ
ncbi:MAG: AbrB/MazE/SpoVT family DNA-binding domain-containing protein [Patescibacteria group bacterium]